MKTLANQGHVGCLTVEVADDNSNFPPSQDSPGFDREHFQKELQYEIADFL